MLQALTNLMSPPHHHVGEDANPENGTKKCDDKEPPGRLEDTHKAKHSTHWPLTSQKSCIFKNPENKSHLKIWSKTRTSLWIDLFVSECSADTDS